MKKLIIITISAFLLCICVVYAAMDKINKDEGYSEKLEISADSGFYNADLLLEAKAPENARIYYTTDGTSPTTEDEAYSGAIELIPKETEKLYNYRFIAFYADGTVSDIESRTYIVGKNVKDRYSTPVLSVYGDPEELFGYEAGIFAYGKAADEFDPDNPVYNSDGKEMNGNFMLKGRENEREVWLDIFSKDGRVLAEQKCGIRIHGKMTRYFEQKSFRLYARREYDDVKNDFKVPVFYDFYSLEDGSIGKKNKRLVVRNAGNDNGSAYVRSELAGRLAGAAGFYASDKSIPVTVYLNGKYNGVYFLETYFDDTFLENLYGEFDGRFACMEGSEREKLFFDEEDEEYAKEYNEFFDEISESDLLDDDNFSKLNEFLDVEDYLKYYAIEYYIGNRDWIFHNYNVYRFISNTGDYQEGTVFDGRYRFQLHDLDYAFGLDFGAMYFAYDDYSSWLFADAGLAPLFMNIMEREDCKEFFAAYLCDIMNYAYSPEKIISALDEINSQRQNELENMLEREKIVTYMPDGYGNENKIPDMAYFNEQTEYIKKYATYRADTVIKDMQFRFDFGDVYQFNIENNSAYSCIRVNSFVTEDDEFEGTYFKKYPLTLSPELGSNEAFDHWEVNGEEIYSDELIIYGSDYEDEVFIALFTRPSDEPKLEIDGISAKGNGDYIDIINLSDKNISTTGYFLTDDDNMYKYALPFLNMRPGEKIRLYGKNYSNIDGLMGYRLNFNVRKYEEISLIYFKDTIETVTIPDMSLDEGIYRKNRLMGCFIEEPVKNEQ